MPMLEDQGLGLMAWSTLSWGRLTGKLRKNQPPQDGHIKSGGSAGGPEVEEDLLYNVIGVLEEIAAETGKIIPQVAIS